MIGHFPEGRRMTELLAAARLYEPDFDAAWRQALAAIRPKRMQERGRLREHWEETRTALRFARPAYRRAYYGEPPERQDMIAQALAHAMEAMYDDSEDAERRDLVGLMEAA